MQRLTSATQTGQASWAERCDHVSHSGERWLDVLNNRAPANAVTTIRPVVAAPRTRNVVAVGLVTVLPPEPRRGGFPEAAAVHERSSLGARPGTGVFVGTLEFVQSWMTWISPRACISTEHSVARAVKSSQASTLLSKVTTLTMKRSDRDCRNVVLRGGALRWTSIIVGGVSLVARRATSNAK